MPNARNVVQCIKLVSAVVIANPRHHVDAPGENQLLFLERVMETPIAPKRVKRISVGNPNTPSYPKVGVIRSVDFAHREIGQRDTRSATAPRNERGCMLKVVANRSGKAKRGAVSCIA